MEGDAGRRPADRRAAQEILELDGVADQLTYEKDGTRLTIRGGVRDQLEACSRDGMFAPPETRCQCAEAPVLFPDMDRDRCDLRYRIVVRYRRQPEQLLEEASTGTDCQRRGRPSRVG